MFKSYKLVSFLLLTGTLFFSENLYAGLAPLRPGTQVAQQNGKISGTITDEMGPVAGASVVVKGTTNGTISDLDGNFTLESIPAGAVITVSFIGYVTQEISYTGQNSLNINLEEDTQKLDEVVVTALGIKREKKALGYAMQELKSESIVEGREKNVANALTGKISGLQVIRSSNGPAGSSKVQIRGKNSITGSNQPLIVVDGVPIDNFLGADNNDFWNPSADMGNGLSDINPEDIASMSVLKGASAAALYGSRAGNGVILITTKTGQQNPGLGITISGSVSAETVFTKPKWQNSFGQGENGVYNERSNYSFGPKITGQSYTKWDGSTGNMQAYNNLDNYIQTGTNLTESIAFSQVYNKTSVYTSMTRMDDKSKIPGANLNRTNFMIRAVSVFGKDDRWTLDGKVQYINSNAKNRPINGQNYSNPFYTMYQLPRSLDIRDFKAAKDENNKMIWFGGSSQVNPYWAKNYIYNRDIRDRFILSGSLKYQFTDWLNGEIRGGSDFYNTEYENKTWAGSPLTDSGRYGVGLDKSYENNFSFLFSAQKDNLFNKFGGAVSFGGNLMMRKFRKISSNPDELLVPDLFTLNNAKNKINSEENFSEKKINSLYGTVQFNYDGFLFLDATLRNDWTSTLSKANRSFLYPSVSLSWVISDMVNKTSNMPEWFTYSKVRASYAQVGNDMEPYQLYNTYWIGRAPDDTTTAGTGEILFDETVKNELIKSWEVGAEVRFFNDRLGIDFSWYKSNSINQLLNIPMDPLSGYKFRKINAGDIQNTGIEIMLNATPVQTKSGFSWDMMLNFSRNRNTIESLIDGVNLYSLGGYDNLQVYANAGGNYGEIWGTKFKRVTDKSSPYFGQMVLTKDGLPTAEEEKVKIGNQEADAMLGFTNTFRYKGISFSFLVDARIGGEIFSATNQEMQLRGTAAKTVVNGERPDITLKGVYLDDNNVYQTNTSSVTAQQYWRQVTQLTGNLGVGEANIYDATNVRLRYISLNYDFNKKMLAKTPFQKVAVGFTCNNVWMIKSHLNGVDPESVFSTRTNAEGFESYSIPTSRSYLFNVTFGF